MKKIILAILVFTFLFVAPQATFALDLGGGIAEQAAQEAGYGAADQFSLAKTIGNVVQVALSLVGIVFTVLIVYGGFLWMTARGEESQVDKAKKVISSSIIGLIITLGAYSITAFVVPRVLERTGGGSGGGLGSPNDPVVGCCLITLPDDTTTRVESNSVGHCNNQCFMENPAATCLFERMPQSQCQ